MFLTDADPLMFGWASYVGARSGSSGDIHFSRQYLHIQYVQTQLTERIGPVATDTKRKKKALFDALIVH